MNTEIKPLAFYLPQYHPIPENNEWWGPGFTEWTRVASAKPLFKGHRQPIIPADLGFYDLRLAQTRQEQADLARKYGVYGFIYYHYWFGNGKMVLEKPLEEVMQLGAPDFPFCLCWANHSWYNTWEADKKNQILVQQYYPGIEDIKKHLEYLLPIFNDPRYIKVDGAPVFMLFYIDMDDVAGTIADYRAEAKKLGIPDLYFIASNVVPWEAGLKDMGFNARVSYAYAEALGKAIANKSIFEKIKYKYRRMVDGNYPRKVDYRKMSGDIVEQDTDVVNFPMVVPNWDNTPRKEKYGFILDHATPELFKKNLRNAIKYLKNKEQVKDKFLILKSWNEWAEGNILEPDTVFGHGFLQSLKEVLDEEQEAGK